MDKKINLKVDGKDIPLNRFVKNVFDKVISGLIDSLDKLPVEKNKIEITITMKEENR